MVIPIEARAQRFQAVTLHKRSTKRSTIACSKIIYTRAVIQSREISQIFPRNVHLKSLSVLLIFFQRNDIYSRYIYIYIYTLRCRIHNDSEHRCTNMDDRIWREREKYLFRVFSGEKKSEKNSNVKVSFFFYARACGFIVKVVYSFFFIFFFLS